MSTNLKNKILNYEQAPPENVWQSIAFELDKDVAVESILTTKLNNYEVIAPDFAWSNIAERLDSEIVAEKMNAYEVVPPIKVWDTISTEINKESAKVISITSVKKSTYYRIAAAAALLILVAVSVKFLNTPEVINNNNTVAATNKIETPITTNTEVSTNSVTTKEQIKETQSSTKQVSIAANTKTKGDEVIEKIEPIKIDEIASLTQNPFNNIPEAIKNETGDVVVDVNLVNNANSYVTIVGPNGESVRLSSKFSKQANYFSERNPEAMENIDYIIKESVNWRKRIADWRLKLSQSTITPSLTNFMDIIELSKIVSDKK